MPDASFVIFVQNIPVNNAENKIEITELVNKLFTYTDSKQWQKLIDEVFTTDVLFDMSSAGGEGPQTIEAEAICNIWREGLRDLDAVHHQAGHYVINVNGDDADIFAYAIAMHYKKSATKGNTRSFVGSYELKATRGIHGWRMTAFKYNLKFMDGNVRLE
jgi:hypothetical protein